MIVPHHTHSAPLLGCHFGPGADAYYRLAVPLGAVGGVVAPFLAMTTTQVEAAETVVVSRFGFKPGSHRANIVGLVAALRNDGGRVLVDYDDDLFSIRANVRHPELNPEAAATVARNADAVVCTNTTLASRLRKLNRDVRVVANYINAADWPEPVEVDAPITIVIAGSHSHINDWHVVTPALRRLKERYAVRVRVCGHLPDYLKPLCDDYRPWGGLDGYQAMLSGAHIGLCPLPDTGFNRCKSPIKAYEYALAGLAVVASPCQYSAALSAAGLTDYLVRDVAGDWFAPIERLVTSAAERRQAATALRAYVLTLDARRHAETIRAAYAA